MDIKIHNDDLPSDLDLGNEIAVDTEAMGLEPKRDPLTLVQISTGREDCHIIQLDRKNYKAKKRKPMFISTAMTNIEEVKKKLKK